MIPDSNTPREYAAELAALHAAGALDGDDVAAMAHCDHCPFGRAALEAFGFENVAAAISSSVFPPVAPSAEMKSKIMARISPPVSEQKEPDTQFVSNDDGEWQTLPGGKIRLKTLSDLPAAGHAMILLEASPGAVFIPHFHEGSEEIFLISGDLSTNGRVLGPGDYLRHAPGTHHPKAISENGCRAILVTARENHPRKAIGTYSEMRNLVKGILGS